MLLKEVFNKTKEILISKLGDEVQLQDDGYYLNHNNSPFWLEFDLASKELTIGYGLTHLHCSEELENIDYGIKVLIGMLTRPLQIQVTSNKKYSFKEKINYMDSGNNPKIFGSSMTLNLRFWDKKTIDTNEIPPILPNTNLELEIKKLYTTQV